MTTISGIARMRLKLRFDDDGVARSRTQARLRSACASDNGWTKIEAGRRMAQKSRFGKPYWWEAAPREAPTDVELPAKCDVAIIGAGYTGLSAALTLARAGRSVI